MGYYRGVPQATHSDTVERRCAWMRKRNESIIRKRETARKNIAIARQSRRAK